MKYWRIAPGHNGDLWVEQRDRGSIAIGWDETGDLDRLGTERRIERRFNEVKREEGWKSKPSQLIKFYKEVRPGHKVIASAGQRIFGLGTVFGRYKFDEELWYEHSKPVRWEVTFWNPVRASELGLPRSVKRRVWPRRPPTIKEVKERDWELVERSIYTLKSPFQGLTNFEGIPRAPESEQETIVLFSKLSQHLKMRIEEVGTRYPDAIVGVKRRGRWVTRSAEFEHLSSGFKSHLRRYNADPESCDMVICWKDDWAQKPRGLEIVALETEMRKIL